MHILSRFQVIPDKWRGEKLNKFTQPKWFISFTTKLCRSHVRVQRADLEVKII